MKLQTILFALLIYNLSFAQVGINTASPTRKLHVSGSMRVRGTINKSESAAYSNILVTDANGNIDYTTKASLQPTPQPGTSNKESYSQIYNMTTESGDPNKALTCGKFSFSFDTGASSNIRFKLSQNPGAAVSVYMSMEQNWDGNGYQFYQGKASSDDATVAFTFDANNWNTYQQFAQANVADFEQNVMHFQYPGDADFYRLTIYRALQRTGTTNYDFAAVCEKF
ncbi:hypothetical protein ACFO4P_12560 [Epilithonimonas pallida]|jgi:hypothetical protein|uniref:CBM11 domain-containing protein n=1 Tax=Epilithonimonas pallida TaxID=373671 RepID=A0ABY1R4H6_9FLAO|nr:hypothetical protein [Epilithonimonas pallida]SMP95354.1 hypothetical protein SAMN05421679_10754 [Epilithonimonas pallida]